MAKTTKKKVQSAPANSTLASKNQTAQSGHRYLEFTYENDAARFCSIENYKSKWKLSDGMLIGDDYPANVEFRMSEDFPEHKGRNDFLHNTHGYMVVQQRVRDFFENKKIPNLQFLKIVVKDHRGRKVPEIFWLVNFTKHVDCIDQKKTEFKWNAIDEEKMTDVKNITITSGSLDKILLARTKHFPGLLIIAQSFADEMKAEGFSGFTTKEISEYKD